VKRNGFTLIEMLIALTIFGMLTAAGVALLSVSARTQETSDRLLAEFGQVRRLSALLTADLGQAATRMHRDGEGRAQRAFAGADGQDDMLLLFVRRGWDDGETTGAQRVGYRLAEGQLQRVAFSRIDGAGQAVVSPLVDQVRGVRLRYRDARGDWRPQWDDPDPTRLPTAVELVLDSARYGPVRMLFTVGGTR
jgi:general secretion pathway protein J